MDEMANRIPNFVIVKGASGGGGSLRLRGIGTSNISAAFDSAIALNIDGVVNNSMRLVLNSFMDLQQVELLKGPQSLYYGKSASAGVLTMRSNDPGAEFEADVSVSYESEQDTTTVFGVISGPLTENFGARLALQNKKTDELFKNTAPGVEQTKRGEESFDARLTTIWEPTDSLDARLMEPCPVTIWRVQELSRMYLLAELSGVRAVWTATRLTVSFSLEMPTLFSKETT